MRTKTNRMLDDARLLPAAEREALAIAPAV